jgi:hypothetical protein
MLCAFVMDGKSANSILSRYAPSHCVGPASDITFLYCNPSSMHGLILVTSHDRGTNQSLLLVHWSTSHQPLIKQTSSPQISVDETTMARGW